MISLLLGGIGLFLVGMWMMTDGLKIAAGDGLQALLRIATSSALRGIVVGVAITAIVQSSSAVTVATIGFVNAGLLTLAQSIWVIFGTNVGTTMTGWLVATIGVKVDIVAFALPLLGVGMILRLVAGARPRLSGLGQAIAGFGMFFLGIGFLQQGFATTTVPESLVGLGHSPWFGIPVFLVVGMALTLLTQSSSAAIAIVLTASSGADLPLVLAAAAVIGTNVGTTSTAALAAFSATPPAKRVAGAHIAFNVLTGCVAVAFLHPLLALSLLLASMFGATTDGTVALAVFHTLFNCVGIVLIWPISAGLTSWLEKRFVNLEEQIGRPRYLDATLLHIPQLALRSLLVETARIYQITHELACIGMSGEGTAPAKMREKLAGVLRLGRAVRGFIEEMNKKAMPADVAEAIPDVIRGLLHLEELARTSLELAEKKLAPTSRSEEAETITMRQHVLQLIAADEMPQGNMLVSGTIEQTASQTEALYQTLKASLLRRAGSAQLRVEVMEGHLLQIQLMRRCAQASWKARRRLGRWFDLLKNDEAAKPTTLYTH
ncbi:Na/Pi cotransporter family protein [Pseudomonas fluorescens]|uniref:Na/Pi cotransporter family protein n=1 Tax=Pseudomonas fluorescens TaxID=294 RepID=A0A944HFR0_PSEFL|nr:Na/Pi symporter [Pseudomonas fluorescens]MBT2298428.1 Na/Pi cotransporter family protein [Pseudomonas fluorescens]MBT2309954.1 Na/Pi cotransporter family protein [Pseudomonas fluorescens]MBT2310977.1 Na/Pi cotransporter family protein [Pseudomonas fluorescens]MBT2320088.1 Na/Pi cotransporter family protein [Pseudomonas fluorescens]MBT2328884.1 Na/Pi cotransporter family protein [Pseudomonas fluorescens]